MSTGGAGNVTHEGLSEGGRERERRESEERKDERKVAHHGSLRRQASSLRCYPSVHNLTLDFF
jgi:hypothetical protein